MENYNIKLINSNPFIFLTNLDDKSDRLDCSWFNPEFYINKKFSKEKNIKKFDIIKLKKIADIKGGKRLPKGTINVDSEYNTIPYVRATNIDKLKVNVSSAIKINKEIHHLIQNYQIKQNDILLTIVGANIGELGILDQKVDVCDFTENVARIRLKDDLVLPNYLLFYLFNDISQKQIKRLTVGALQFKLSLSSLKTLDAYIPLTENKTFDIIKQEKIINKTNSIFEKIRNKTKEKKIIIDRINNIVENNLKIQINLVKESKSVYLNELNNSLSDRLDVLYNTPARKELDSVLKKYSYKKLSQLAIQQKKEKIVFSDYYKLIELEQIDESIGCIKNYIEVPELGSEKLLLKNNTIIVSKLQPEKGKIAIISNDLNGCVGSSEFIPLRLLSDEVSLKYLWAILRSPYVLKQWEYLLTGSSRMRIGMTELKNTIIPIVNPKLQDLIVNEIEDEITNVNKLTKEIELINGTINDEFIKILFD